MGAIILYVLIIYLNNFLIWFFIIIERIITWI